MTDVQSSLFSALRPMFVENASPEAIRAEIKELRAKRRRIDDSLADLFQLLGRREEQVEQGAWPAAEARKLRMLDQGLISVDPWESH